MHASSTHAPTSRPPVRRACSSCLVERSTAPPAAHPPLSLSVSEPMRRYAMRCLVNSNVGAVGHAMQWAFRNSYTYYIWHVRMACCGLRLRMTVRLLWMRIIVKPFFHIILYTVFVRSLGHSRTAHTRSRLPDTGWQPRCTPTGRRNQIGQRHRPGPCLR